MGTEHSQRRRDVIAEEAAVWLVRLEDAAPRAKSEFAAWLKSSPEHVEEFLAIAALWDTLPAVPSRPSPGELVELARRADNVVALDVPSADAPEAQTTTPVAARRRGIGLGAAAVLAAVVLGAALTLRAPPADPNLHTTAIGEQASIPLADGSLVTLNTQSTMRVEYSAAFRDIHLARGEALFDVAKDPGRSFRVITRHAVIQAVGTQFNVRSEADDVTVTVVEGEVDVVATSALNLSGRVARLPEARSSDRPPSGAATASDASAADAVRPTRLKTGEQARVASRSSEVAVVETAVEKATAWRERRLVFEALPLGEVIDEFNRYNDPPLLIEDETLKVLPINGVFRANDRKSFVAFLDQMRLAEYHTRADGTIVLRGVERGE